jgi:hypothetical protein
MTNSEKRAAVTAGRTVALEVGPSRRFDLPSVGIAVPRHTTDTEPLVLLTALRLGYLHVSLGLSTRSWPRRLERAGELSRATATPLELSIAVGADPAAEIDSLARALPLAQAAVTRFALRPRAERPDEVGALLDLARAALSAQAPRAAVALTSPAPSGEGLHAALSPAPDAIVLPLARPRSRSVPAAIARALDHGSRVRAAHPRADVPLVVGPVGAELAGAPGDAMPASAAWMLASLAGLADAGVSAVSYAAARGAVPFLGPGSFVLPSYHVVADLQECVYGQVGVSSASAPREVAILCAHTVRGVRVMLANLTGDERRCRLDGLSADRVTVRSLDSDTIAAACARPAQFRQRGLVRDVRGGSIGLTLRPYAYVRVDA